MRKYRGEDHDGSYAAALLHAPVGGGAGSGQGYRSTQFNPKLDDTIINGKSEAFSMVVQAISRCEKMELVVNMVVKIIVGLAC